MAAGGAGEDGVAESGALAMNRGPDGRKGKTNEMFPCVLHGHDKPMTHLCYNREGDLLFSASKGYTACAWWADTGERLGTYTGTDEDETAAGHSGAISFIDVSPDSQFVLTSGRDQFVKLWEAKTGRVLRTWPMPGLVQCASFNENGTAFVAAVEGFAGRPSCIQIHKIHVDASGEVVGDAGEKVPTFESGRVFARRVLFGRLNAVVFAGMSDGRVLCLDGASLEVVREVDAAGGGHSEQVSSLQFNADKTLLITGSGDCTAKLWDPVDLKLLRTYKSPVPVHGAAISPIMDHVFVAGGQHARDVAKTAASTAKFETRIYSLSDETELATIGGHFGPVNTLAIAPDGRSFVTGGEEAFIRLQFLPPAYYTLGVDKELDNPEVKAAADAAAAAEEEGKSEEMQAAAAEAAFDAALAIKP